MYETAAEDTFRLSISPSFLLASRSHREHLISIEGPGRRVARYVQIFRSSTTISSFRGSRYVPSIPFETKQSLRILSPYSSAVDSSIRRTTLFPFPDISREMILTLIILRNGKGISCHLMSRSPEGRLSVYVHLYTTHACCFSRSMPLPFAYRM